MIGKLKYVGKTFGVESLTDGKIYDVVSIEYPYFRIIDDSNEDYLYSISKPADLENQELCGKWQIIEDNNNEILKAYISKES